MGWSRCRIIQRPRNARNHRGDLRSPEINLWRLEFFIQEAEMSDDIGYIKRNLSGRTVKAVDDFKKEVVRVMSEATLAGALHGSRTFINYWQAALLVFERKLNSAFQFAYNASGKHTGEIYDELAQTAQQMLDGMVGHVREKAGANDRAFGGGYSEIVDRMLVAMDQKRDQLLDDFKHGVMGDEKLKKDPVVSIVANQTGSPGAVQQIGVGDFSQSAFVQNHRSLVEAVEKALKSPEFAQLEQEQKDGFKDVADALLDEAKKTAPDPGKLKRWGMRAVDLAKELGLHVAAAE